MFMNTKCFLLVCLFMCAGIYGTYAQTPQKYAVIITGDAPGDGYQGQFGNSSSNYNEFWNDTYLMWEMLVTKFGFSNDKVFVLYAGGEDFSSQNPRYTVAHSLLPLDHITDFSASLTNVQDVLGGLADGSNDMPKITEEDFLFVFTFGHGHITGLTGSPPYHGVLELFDNDVITDTELSTLVNAIDANKRVIWMQNCASGDFAYEFTNDKNYFVAGTLPYPTG